MELVNYQEIAQEISNVSGIDKDVIEKMLIHQTEIKEILEELSFISSDSLVVVKEHLEKLRKDNSEIPIDRIINVLSALVSIGSAFKQKEQ